MDRYRSGHNGPDSKSGSRASGSWVRIPPCPPQALKVQDLTVVRDYKSCGGAENGVTVKVTPFSASKGRFCDHVFCQHGDLHLVHKVEDNLHLLSALAAGLVRCVNDDLLDILVDNRLRQLRDIHLLFRQRNESVQIVAYRLPLFNPFFRCFNFEL